MHPGYYTPAPGYGRLLPASAPLHPSSFEGWFFTFWAGALVVLFALPWLDTSPVRSGRFRPMFKVFFWILVADCALLTYAGGQPPEGLWLILSRIGAAYYFAHFFLVLPFIARVERPRPLPTSIGQTVLSATKSAGP